jgi:LysR family transcriptional regulator, carnitine catabolism transcriptional activator
MLDSLRQIRSFLAVVRLRSFTRASKELHMAQSTLTVQVKQLEGDLGVRLLDRDKRHVSLTTAGRQLIGGLEKLIFDADSVMRITDDWGDLKRGMIDVAVLPSIATRLFPDALKLLLARYPGIQVRVHDVVAGRVIQMVKSGEVEFGITGDVGHDSDLTIDYLTSDRMCAFIPSGHALASETSVGLRDLRPYPLILTGVDSSVRELITRSVVREHISLIPTYEVNYISTALGMVQGGLGIAILPESSFTLNQELSVHVARIERPALERRISIVRRRGVSFSAASEALVSTLQSVSREAARFRGSAISVRAAKRSLRKETTND